MYPVVIGNGRCLQSDAVVAGYHVPKGVRNYIIYFIHFFNKIKFTVNINYNKFLLQFIHV